jgi:hypothetical protein
VTYSTEHDDALPDSLAELMDGNHLPDRSILQSPGVSRSLPADLEAMDPEQRAAAVRQFSSYLLVDRTPLDEVQRPESRILMVERPGDAPDDTRVAVLFHDMHVETMPVDKAALRIERQTDVTLERWVEAAEAGQWPAGFQAKRSADNASEETIEVEAAPLKEQSDSTAPPAPR